MPTINSDTLAFFEELNQNNNRDWFLANKARWDAIRRDFLVFTQALVETMTKIDPGLGDLDASKCIYRIYRDLRFSPDKRPYKTHISCFLATGGRKNCGVPGYYFQMGQEDYGLTGNCSLGGGIFMPEPKVLEAIRQEIYYSTDEFLAIMEAPDFKRFFGNEFWTTKKLSRVPKGYPADWPHADLLKYKDYTVNYEMQYPFTDDLFDKVIEVFRASVPLNKFIRKAMD